MPVSSCQCGHASTTNCTFEEAGAEACSQRGLRGWDREAPSQPSHACQPRCAKSCKKSTRARNQVRTGTETGRAVVDLQGRKAVRDQKCLSEPAPHASFTLSNLETRTPFVYGAWARNPARRADSVLSDMQPGLILVGLKPPVGLCKGPLGAFSVVFEQTRPALGCRFRRCLLRRDLHLQRSAEIASGLRGPMRCGIIVLESRSLKILTGLSVKKPLLKSRDGLPVLFQE